MKENKKILKLCWVTERIRHWMIYKNCVQGSGQKAVIGLYG
ncbi:uncharacterized protein METZ01_LOCUS314870 [marine metagenome]|uniref:Uncharacterized protein n=1 Tax=marine metagenome TaxID=408172 RepID=A0A382NLP0_9ZZZZ